MNEIPSGIRECEDNLEKKVGAEKAEVDSKIEEIDLVIERLSEKLRESEEKAACAKKTEDVLSPSIKKKIISIASVMLIAVVAFASSTYAYFTATVGSSFNVIQSASGVEFDFVDLVYLQDSSSGVPMESVTDRLTAYPGENVKRDIYAVNRGQISIYVRAKLSSSVTLDARYADKADLIDPSLVSYSIDENYWVTRDTFDGYYYYILPLAGGEQTTALISSVNFSEKMGNMYKGSKVAVKAVFEVVQSNGNGASVLDAGGWPLDMGGGADS